MSKNIVRRRTFDSMLESRIDYAVLHRVLLLTFSPVLKCHDVEYNASSCGACKASKKELFFPNPDVDLPFLALPAARYWFPHQWWPPPRINTIKGDCIYVRGGYGSAELIVILTTLIVIQVYIICLR